VAGPESVAQLAGENDISETLVRTWRDQFLIAGAQRLEGNSKRIEADELRKQITRLERVLGQRTMELEILGGTLAGAGSETACRSIS